MRKSLLAAPETFSMIRSILTRRKRTVIEKKALVEELLRTHRRIKRRQEIDDAIEVILKTVPEWCCVRRLSEHNFFRQGGTLRADRAAIGGIIIIIIIIPITRILICILLLSPPPLQCQ